MTVEGMVVNGMLILDGGAQLPEGARIRLEVIDPDDFAPPPESYDREKELASLRESLADVRASGGMPFEEFMAKLAEEYQLPPAPPE